MTHSELCRAVAERLGRARGTMVTLYEYQGYATSEFPDVLMFNGSTVLYEIKTSRSDFFADAKKEVRIKWRPKVEFYHPRYPDMNKFAAQALPPELYYIQRPHLGSLRFFVCEPGLIAREEVPEGWGLLWFKGGRLYQKADSKSWRPDVHAERNILAHAMRRYASGDHTGIIVNTYYLRDAKDEPTEQGGKRHD